MKAVLLVVAALAVVALAATGQTYNNVLGYDMEASADKSNGVFYMTVDVPTAQLPPYNSTTKEWTAGTYPVLRVRNQFISNTNGATVKFFASMNGQNPDTTGTPVVTKAATSPSDVTYDWDISAMTPGPTTTTFIWAGVISCTTCVSTGDVKIAFNLAWKTGADTVLQDFAAKDDSYTFDYSIKASQYGPCGAILTLTAATDIYTKVSMQTSSKGAAVLMTYVMAGTAKPADPVTTVQTDTFKKYPSGSAITGDYSTGAINLAAGTWIATPYGISTVVKDTSMGFDFALGFGHQPAAAGSVLPSFFVLATLLLSSAFAYLFL